MDQETGSDEAKFELQRLLLKEKKDRRQKTEGTSILQNQAFRADANMVGYQNGIDEVFKAPEL